MKHSDLKPGMRVRVRNDLVKGYLWSYGSMFDYRGKVLTLFWVGNSVCSVKENNLVWTANLFEQEEPMFKEGDKVLVRDFNNIDWQERIFLHKLSDKFECPYVTTTTSDHSSDYSLLLGNYKYCKPLEVSTCDGKVVEIDGKKYKLTEVV